MQPLYKQMSKKQLLQNCIGPTIRIGQEILCVLYAGFFFKYLL